MTGVRFGVLTGAVMVAIVACLAAADDREPTAHGKPAGDAKDPPAPKRAPEDAPEKVAFFESKVRPLLLAKCVECHGDKKAKGELRLDSRAGWAKGGESGPAIVPGKPDESLLIKAVRYQDKDLQMPPKKALSLEEVKILE